MGSNSPVYTPTVTQAAQHACHLYEGVKKSTSAVILSGAKDLHSFVFNVMQMLREVHPERTNRGPFA
jgi:hypothetical protein